MENNSSSVHTQLIFTLYIYQNVFLSLCIVIKYSLSTGIAMLRYVFIIMCYFYELSNTSILSNRTVKICDCCYCYQVVCLPLQMLWSLFVTLLPLSCSDRMLYFVTPTAHHPSAIMHLCIYTSCITTHNHYTFNTVSIKVQYILLLT